METITIKDAEKSMTLEMWRSMTPEQRTAIIYAREQAEQQRKEQEFKTLCHDNIKAYQLLIDAVTLAEQVLMTFNGKVLNKRYIDAVKKAIDDLAMPEGSQGYFYTPTLDFNAYSDNAARLVIHIRFPYPRSIDREAAFPICLDEGRRINYANSLEGIECRVANLTRTWCEYDAASADYKRYYECAKTLEEACRKFKEDVPSVLRSFFSSKYMFSGLKNVL